MLIRLPLNYILAEVLQREDLRNQHFRVLRTLSPEDQRLVLMVAEQASWSTRQIALELGCSHQTVAWRRQYGGQESLDLAVKYCRKLTKQWIEERKQSLLEYIHNYGRD